MRSAAHVADAATALLRAELPRRVPLMREAWNVDAELLPDPDSVEAGELTEQAASGSIGNTIVRVLTPREYGVPKRIDIEPGTGHPILEIRYSTRLQVVVKAPDWPTSIVARDYVLSAVRAAVLEYPTLSVELGFDTGYAVELSSLSATYGTPTRASGTGTDCWCGGMLTCDIRSEESVAQGSSRPVATPGVTFNLEVEKVPTGAPFPAEHAGD